MKLKIKKQFDSVSDLKHIIIGSIDKNFGCFSYNYISSLNDFCFCNVICIHSKNNVDELLVHIFRDPDHVTCLGFQKGDKIDHPCWFTYDGNTTFSSSCDCSCDWVVDKLSLLSGLFSLCEEKK